MKKRTIFPFIFNGKLTYKLARTTVVSLLGITLICSGISGCDNGEDIVTPTKTETAVEPTVPVIDHLDGESIYFELAGTTYEGRVVKGVSVNEVEVRLTDGSDMVINVDRIGGTLVADHPDLNVKAILWSQNEGERILTGRVKGVYTDGMCKIEIFAVSFDDKPTERLDPPRIRFARRTRNQDDWFNGDTWAEPVDLLDWNGW